MSDLRKCCKTPKGKGPHVPGCHQGFATPRGLRDDLDRGGIPKDVRREILNDAFGDLPDGAYLEMAREFGLNLEDLAEGG